MRKTRFAFCFLLVLASCIAQAQLPVPNNLTYEWPAATTGTAGQLGKYIVLTSGNQPASTNYTVDVTVVGTAPATCTFRVEGSSDGLAWYGLDVTSPATTSCVTNYMESIANRPVVYLRINLTYTQGDTTTVVKFHWTGSKS